MRHGNITATRPIENRLFLIQKKKMAREISLKTVKASTDNPNDKPHPEDKTPVLEPASRFCEIEDVDNTEEGEEAKNLNINDSSLTATKKNLIKRKFLYIDTFKHEGPTVIRTMRNISVRVFEHPEIASGMYVGKGLNTQSASLEEQQ